MSKELVKAISELHEDEALRLAQQAIDKGEDPTDILGDCSAAMKIVGKRFEEGEYYLPELIASGAMLKKVSDIVKPKLKAGTAKGGVGRKGKIVIGAVHGDVHDIGKGIVSFLLDTNGYEVHDLGVDVPEGKFVEAVKEFKPQVVAMSGLLSSIYDSMQSTIKAIEKAGLRSKVKIMIGGGMIDENVKSYTGADAYGKDAMAAVTLANEWIPEK
ncbi:B12-binding domain-containing protein [Chloroflexota bacterium]